MLTFFGVTMEFVTKFEYSTLTPKKVSDSTVTPKKVNARLIRKCSYIIAAHLKHCDRTKKVLLRTDDRSSQYSQVNREGKKVKLAFLRTDVPSSQYRGSRDIVQRGQARSGHRQAEQEAF